MLIESPDELEALRSSLLSRHHELMNAEDWEQRSNKDGIEASWKTAKGRIYILKAKSTIKTSAENLFDYLVTRLPETCKEWNDVMLKAGVLKQLGNEAAIGTVVSEGDIARDREDVFYQFTLKENDGKLYELSKGIPIDKTKTSYVLRSELIFCSKQFDPIDNNSCTYHTIWHYNPAGKTAMLMPVKMLSQIVLKNLVHEHQKLKEIFD